MSATHPFSRSDAAVWLQALAEPFRVDVEPERDVVRVCPSGEVDLATASAIGEQIGELTAAGFARVVLDLRGVTFIDSTGLCLVLEVDACSRREGWEFAIIAGPAAVQRAYEVAGLRTRLPFVDTPHRPGLTSWR